MKVTREQLKGFVKEELLKEVESDVAQVQASVLDEVEDRLLDIVELAKSIHDSFDELGRQHGEMANMTSYSYPVVQAVNKMYEKFDTAITNMEKYRTSGGL